MAKYRKPESEGLVPVDEIARALGISTQRVHQLQASGLKKFRKGLAARGYGAEMTDLPAWLVCYILESEASE